METEPSLHDVFLEICDRQSEITKNADTESPIEGESNEASGAKVVALNDLKFTRFLNISPKTKKIFIECSYQDKPAIVGLEKTPFDEQTALNMVGKFSEMNIKNLFRNDIYGTYLMDLVLAGDTLAVPQNQQNFRGNTMFVTIIHPARQKDIEKYLNQSVYLVRETALLYETLTKPFVESLIAKPGHLQWLYNVLEHKAETDRIIYEENLENDNGFILAKDMKWKQKEGDQLSEAEKEDIHLTALVIRRDLRSLRDLRAEHIPLLEAIYERGRDAISRRYSVDRSQLRVYVHYQPSFYHLHVHFTHIKAEQYGFQAERAHMLSSVIENLRFAPDYYQRVAIEFPLNANSELKPEQFQ